jgi:hypothetical protein
VAATVPSAPSAAAASTSGYWLVGTDGGIFSFGKAAFMGSTGAVKLNQPIVSMAATPDGKGYWMVASDGGIFTFGSATFYGSLGAVKLNQPIVGMAATRTGKGYWLVASDGGIFAFGDAGFFGSTGNVKLAKPIVDIVPSPSGRGYWMAASDGGIFAFGDAGFFGSTGAVKLAKRIQQMAATPTGKGYWMVAGDGGIFAFGDARFYGSAVDGGPEKRIVDMATSATGNGYYLTASNGAVYAYGDAKPYGGLEDQKLAHGIIAMVALNNGEPPVAVDDLLNIDEDGSGSIDVLGNDRDPDGTPLSVQSVSGSAKGATISVSGGTITYKPVTDSNGTDTFTYTLVDDRGNTAVATVTVKIRAIDDLPSPVADSITVPIGQTVTIHVLGNDIGLGDGLRLLEIVGQPGKGSVTLSPDGTALVYTATKRTSSGNPDTIRYRVWDSDNDNADGIVRITVTGPDLQARAVDVSQECRTDCVVDLLTKGASTGDNGHVRLVDPNQAGVTLNGPSGTTITFTGSSTNFADVPVHYQIVDDNNGANPQQVSDGTVTFKFRNATPSAVAENAGASPSGAYQLHGQDTDNDTLTYIVDESPAPYFNSFNPADGTFRLDGAPGPGVYVIRFRVFDGTASSAVAEYTITL